MVTGREPRKTPSTTDGDIMTLEVKASSVWGHKERWTWEGQGVGHATGQFPCPRLGRCYIFNVLAMQRNEAGGGGGEGTHRGGPGQEKVCQRCAETWGDSEDRDIPGSETEEEGS